METTFSDYIIPLERADQEARELAAYEMLNALDWELSQNCPAGTTVKHNIKAQTLTVRHEGMTRYWLIRWSGKYFRMNIMQAGDDAPLVEFFGPDFDREDIASMTIMNNCIYQGFPF